MNVVSSLKTTPGQDLADHILATPHSVAALRAWGIFGNQSRLPQAHVEVVSGTEQSAANSSQTAACG